MPGLWRETALRAFLPGVTTYGPNARDMADSPSNQETQGYAHAVSNHDRRLAAETGMAAEPNTLWAPWKSSGAELARAKRDATVLARKTAKDAGVDIVTEGDRRASISSTGFLEKIEGIDFATRSRWESAGSLQGDGAHGGGTLRLSGRVHADKARIAAPTPRAN